MKDTAREVRMNSQAMYSCRSRHIEGQKLDDQREPIYNSEPIKDVAWKTTQEWWTIETGGERGSGRALLALRYDDDDDDDDIRMISDF